MPTKLNVGIFEVYHGGMTRTNLISMVRVEVMALYPFCRLSGPANVLVMPGLHSAQISSTLLRELGGGNVIGPILMGATKPVQIVPMGATVSDIVNMAALAASEANC